MQSRQGDNHAYTTLETTRVPWKVNKFKSRGSFFIDVIEDMYLIMLNVIFNFTLEIDIGK